MEYSEGIYSSLLGRWCWPRYRTKSVKAYPDRRLNRCQSTSETTVTPHRRAVNLTTAARGLLCGLLAAGVACGRPLPDSALMVVPSPAPTAIVACDVVPLGKTARSGDETATVRFVTYGDADRGDSVGCGMVPDARLAIIAGYVDIADWWKLVGVDLGIREQAPPGLQIPVSGEKLSATPTLLVTTGPDGTVETSIPNTGGIITICAMSVITEDTIAGCSHETIRLKDGTTVYVYFSHGHAIVETGSEGSERYQRFLNGTDISNQPRGTVFLVSLFYRDYGPETFFLSPSRQVAIIEDAYIDTWWSEASKGEDVDLDMSGFGYGPYFDPKVLNNKWGHVVTTGDTGVAKIALPPGDYLFCQVDGAGCDYEDIAGSREHVLKIDLSSGFSGHGGVRMLTTEGKDSKGKQLLADATRAPINPRPTTQ